LTGWPWEEQIVKVDEAGRQVISEDAGWQERLTGWERMMQDWILDIIGRGSTPPPSDPRVHQSVYDRRALPNWADPIPPEDLERLKREEEERGAPIGLNRMRPMRPMARAMQEQMEWDDRPAPQIPLPPSWTPEQVAEFNAMGPQVGGGEIGIGPGGKSPPYAIPSHEPTELKRDKDGNVIAGVKEPPSFADIWYDTFYPFIDRATVELADTEAGEAALTKLGEYMSTPQVSEGLRSMQEPGTQPPMGGATPGEILEDIPDWVEQPMAELMIGMHPGVLLSTAQSINNIVRSVSKMRDVLKVKLPNKGTSEQMVNVINAFANKPGGGDFKKDELQWSGLLDAIKQHGGTVTKDWIDDWLHHNNVKVRMNARTGSDTRYAQYMEGLGDNEGQGKNYREILLQWDRADPEAGKISFDRWMELMWEGNERRDWPQPGSLAHNRELTKYTRYTELGDDPNFNDWYRVYDPESAQAAWDSATPVLAWDNIHQDESLRLKFDEEVREISLAVENEIDPQMPALYTSGHFAGYPDLLANILVADFIDPVTGEKILHIYELQSDWFQAIRTSGYTVSNPENLARARTLRTELGREWTAKRDLYADEMNASYTRLGEAQPGTTSPSGHFDGGLDSARRLRSAWNDRAEDLQVRRAGWPSESELRTEYGESYAEQLAQIPDHPILKLDQEIADALTELNRVEEVLADLTDTSKQIRSADRAIDVARKGDWNSPAMWTNPVTKKREKFPDLETRESWRLEHEALSAGEMGPGSRSASLTRFEELGELLNSEDRKHSGINVLRRNAKPDAPFKKTWTKLALKTMIQHATEEGYSKISWSSGATVADRYNLRNFVTTVDWKRDHDDPGGIEITYHLRSGGTQIEHMREHDMADHMGREPAQKISDNDNLTGTIDAESVQIGGVKTDRFYDKQLTNEANDLAKRFGGKVTTTNLHGPPGSGGEVALSSQPHFRDWVRTTYGQLRNRRARRLNIQRNQAQGRLDASRKLWDDKQKRHAGQLELPGTIKTRAQYNAAHNNLTTQLGEAQAELDGWGEINLADSTPEDWAAQSASREKVDQLTRDLADLGPGPKDPTAAEALSHEYTWKHYREDQRAAAATDPAQWQLEAGFRRDRMRAAAIQEGVNPYLVMRQDESPVPLLSFREWLEDNGQLPEVEIDDYSEFRRSAEDIASDLGVDIYDEEGDVLSDADIWARIDDEEGDVDFDIEYDTEAISEHESDLIDEEIVYMEDNETSDWVEYREENPDRPTEGPLLPSARKPFREWYEDTVGEILDSGQLEELIPRGEDYGSPRHLRMIATAEADEVLALMEDTDYMEDYLRDYASAEPPARPVDPYEAAMIPAEKESYTRDTRAVSDAESSLRELVSGSHSGGDPSTSETALSADISEAQLQRRGLLLTPEGDDLVSGYFGGGIERDIADPARIEENNTFFDFEKVHRRFIQEPDRTDYGSFPQTLGQGGDVMEKYRHSYPENVGWSPIGWEPSQGDVPLFPTQAEAAQASSRPVHTLEITPEMRAAFSQDPSMGMPLFPLVPPVAALAPLAAQMLTPQPSHETDQEHPPISPLVR
jgi:hypothetical protein